MLFALKPKVVLQEEMHWLASPAGRGRVGGARVPCGLYKRMHVIRYLITIQTLVATMLHLIKNPLSDFLKIHSVQIDSYVFRLHYKATLAILSAFSILVAPGTFFGEPVDCWFHDFAYKALNTWCYVHSTFSVVGAADHDIRDDAGRNHPYAVFLKRTEKDEVRFVDYYRWVCVSLTIQAICCYMPHHIWKILEGGKMKALTVGLDSLVVSKDCIKNVKLLVEFLHKTLHSHDHYFYKHLSCEFLNVINIVAQIAFMNSFLGSDFAFYGIHVLSFNHTKGSSSDPAARLFPTRTKCSYYKFTSYSGELKSVEGICVLSQNSINAKIYCFLWFWFHGMAIIGAIVVAYRITEIMSARIRLKGIRSSICTDPNDIYVVNRKLQVGDWFLLKTLKRNLSPEVYDELIIRIAQRLRGPVADV